MDHRGADAILVEEIGTAEGIAIAAKERIRHRAIGNVVVIRFPLEAIGMDGERADAAVQQRRALARIRVGAVQTGELRRKGLVRQTRGNAVVDGVDDAADRLAAVAQRRRAADHLDSLRRQRIDRNSVVRTDVGDIEAADAVFERAHPIRIESANDGPAGSGCEAAAGHAGSVRERIREIGATGAQDFVAVDGFDDGRELVFGRDRRGADDDRVDGRRGVSRVGGCAADRSSKAGTKPEWASAWSWKISFRN